MSEDSLGVFSEDQNLYRYVLSSPLSFTDPDGNQAAEIIGIITPIVPPVGIIIGGICAISSNNSEKLKEAMNKCLEERNARHRACETKPPHVRDACKRASELKFVACTQNAQIQFPRPN